MHFSNGIRAAFIGICFSQLALGSPVALAPRPAFLQMQPATVAFIGERHVDKYATNCTRSRRNDVDLETRSVVTRLAKIQCGLNGGGYANYDAGKERYRSIVSSLSNPAALVVGQIEVKLQDMLCTGDFGLCDMAISAAISSPGWLFADQLPGLFDAAFDSIREQCRENGGLATLVADYPPAYDFCGMPTCGDDGKPAILVADFAAQFYAHDEGATCPASAPVEDICVVERFN